MAILTSGVVQELTVDTYSHFQIIASHSQGTLAPTANPYAEACSEDMHLCFGLSCAEHSFELWEAHGLSVVAIFDVEAIRDACQRTNFRLRRAVAFAQRALWESVSAKTLPPFDREGSERYVCELQGTSGRCGLFCSIWNKYIAHQTHNKGGSHGINSLLLCIANIHQLVIWGSTRHTRGTARTTQRALCTARTDILHKHGTTHATHTRIVHTQLTPVLSEHLTRLYCLVYQVSCLSCLLVCRSVGLSVCKKAKAGQTLVEVESDTDVQIVLF